MRHAYYSQETEDRLNKHSKGRGQKTAIEKQNAKYQLEVDTQIYA